MPYVEIELMTPAYLAAAALALDDRRCPDCDEPVGVMGTGHRGGGEPVEILECLACDTEWAPTSTPSPLPHLPALWHRSRRGLSILDEYGNP